MQPVVTGRLMAYRGGDKFFSTAELRMGSGNSGKLVSAVKKRLKDAGDAGSIAVIDGSPGIGCPVIASVSGVDLVLVVTEPTLSGLSDLERILSTAFQLGAKCAVCVNKADVNEKITGGIEAFCAKVGLPFVGRIPYDIRAVEAVNAGVDVIGYGGEAAEAIESLYNQITALLIESEVET
jgi:MinD superfamily P-loop ATPase